MDISINDQILSQFFNGVVAVVMLVAAGWILAFISRPVGEKFTFTRLALVLAIPPFCLINLLDRGSLSTLYLYAIVVVVLCIAIDGIHHLFPPREGRGTKPKPKKDAGEPEPNAIVWEKVE